jgi:hypothetical protein
LFSNGTPYILVVQRGRFQPASQAARQAAIQPFSQPVSQPASQLAKQSASQLASQPASRAEHDQQQELNTATSTRTPRSPAAPFHLFNNGQVSRSMFLLHAYIYIYMAHRGGTNIDCDVWLLRNKRKGAISLSIYIYIHVYIYTYMQYKHRS